MSPFETVSVKIAYWQMCTMIASVVIALIGVTAAIWTLRELVKQVRAAVDLNSIGQLNALLVLEQDMSRRRDRLGEMLSQLHNVKNSDAYGRDKSILDPVIAQFNESQENYLNSLDRLCFCILKGKFSEDELRSDYRDVVRRAIEDFPNSFQAATPFRNILKIHNRWADS